MTSLTKEMSVIKGSKTFKKIQGFAYLIIIVISMFFDIGFGFGMLIGGALVNYINNGSI